MLPMPWWSFKASVMIFPDICWREWARVDSPVGRQLLFRSSFLCRCWRVSYLVSWYFEPSQPQRLTSELKQTLIYLLFSLHTSHQTTNSLKTTKSVLTEIFVAVEEDCTSGLLIEVFDDSDRVGADVVLLHGCPQSCMPNPVGGLLKVYEDMVGVLLVLKIFITEDS